MNCEICNRNPATIHIRELVDGKRRALHICGDCASNKKFTTEALKDFTLADFLGSFGTVASQFHDLAPTGIAADDETDDEDYPDIVCPTCGMKTAEFHEHGSLGCPDCYEAFAPILDEVLPTFHRGVVHAGRAPGQAPAIAPARLAPASPIADLRLAVLGRELQDAVTMEAYERAAELRDEILRLQHAGEA